MDEKLFVTHEDYKNRVLHVADRRYLDAFKQHKATGSESLMIIDEHSFEIIQINSPHELREWAMKASIEADAFANNIRAMMNDLKARHVYSMRTYQRFSWRLLADTCAILWKPERVWFPTTHQAAGMMLCRIAGEVLQTRID